MRDVAPLILAGGLGTRLRPVLVDRPKALAPVGDRPFVTFLLDQLVAAEFQQATLLVGHGAAEVQEALGREYGELALDYSVERSPLGTAGAVRHALPRLDARTILVMNGDSYCDVDLGQFVWEHRRRQAEVSMVVAAVSDTGRFGRIRLADDGRIVGFSEKSQGGPGAISAGIYLVERALLAEIPAGRAVSLEREMLPRWLSCCRPFAFRGGGRFLDIGTPEDFAAAQEFFGAETACS